MCVLRTTIKATQSPGRLEIFPEQSVVQPGFSGSGPSLSFESDLPASDG